MLPSTSIVLVFGLISTSTAINLDASSRSSRRSWVKSIYRTKRAVVNTPVDSLLQMAGSLQASTSYVACQISFEVSSAVDSIGGTHSSLIDCESLLLQTSPSPNTSTSSATVSTTPTISNPAIPTYSSQPPTATLAAFKQGLPGSSSPIVAVAAVAPSTVAPSNGITTCSSSKTLACTSKQEALSIQNVARARHGVQPLVWDNDLEEAAAKWANKCEWAHSPAGSLFPATYHYGENMYASTSSSDTLATAVGSFLIEEKSYDYASQEFDPNAGQFTQVIWKDTQKVGCALVQCGLKVFSAETNSTTLVTCLFYPAGNVNTQTAFAQNVLPPIVASK